MEGLQTKDSEDTPKSFLPYSSSSENSDSQDEDVEEIIRSSRQVLKETGQKPNTDFKVPYKYDKEQAIAKLEEIAETFIIEHSPDKRSSDFQKSQSSSVLLQGVSSVLLQENDSDSSDSELIVMNQPKRTLPSVSHLLMRKELREKAKHMAQERQYKYNGKQENNDVEQRENSSDNEEAEPLSEEESLNTFCEETETLKGILEDGTSQSESDRVTIPMVSNQSNSTTELYYIQHTTKTFGK